MPVLIDGHNLIGAHVFDDIRLSDEDDEAKLVARLKVWRSRVRGKITVVFDRGIPGGRDVKMGGAGVDVIFAADPVQADDLIRRRLRRAKPGLTLVTNDDALVREANVYGVDVLRGDEFVQRMQISAPDLPEAGMEDDIRLSKAEVDEWLQVFGGEPDGKPKRKRKRKPRVNRRAAGQDDSQAAQAGRKPRPKPKSKRSDGKSNG